MTKKEQRILALARRRAMRPEERAQASGLICESLLALPELQDARVIFSYMAMAEEVDLTALHERLRWQGLQPAFPLSLPRGRMEARLPGGWRVGAYGIREPDPASSTLVAPEDIDLVMMPCVAFDRENMRLGHGAGYYDRYLPQCPQAVTVMVAFEAQRLEHVVFDVYDRAADIVVTERGVYRK